MSTNVRVVCLSKHTSLSNNKENPIQTSIELGVPYDPESIYFQMSGGSNFMLHTINQQAADMFELGKKYDVVISPSPIKAEPMAQKVDPEESVKPVFDKDDITTWPVEELRKIYTSIAASTYKSLDGTEVDCILIQGVFWAPTQDLYVDA